MGKQNAETIVNVQSLVVTYGDYTAVKDLSFEVHAGEVFGLLGTNGAGKTSTLEVIEGFRKPAKGEVLVFGETPYGGSKNVRKNSGFVLQQAGFFNELSVEATLTWWGSISGRDDEPSHLLERCNLVHRKDEAVAALSGGERRRLDLAMALWGSPKLLILDEPTTGLDPESRRRLWEIIEDQRSAGAAVLLTTHYLDEAERLCDRVLIMDKGASVVEGHLSELQNAQAMFGSLDIAGTQEQVLEILPESLCSQFSITHDQELTRLEFSGIELPLVLQGINALYGADNISISAMSIRPRTLEEIFMGVADGNYSNRKRNED